MRKALSDETSQEFIGLVILVHTTDPQIVRAIKDVSQIKIGTETFLKGTLISPDVNHFDNGKTVRLNLRFVLSITEFDSPEQFMTHKKGELKLLPSSHSVDE